MCTWWGLLTRRNDLHLHPKPRVGSLQFGFRSIDLFAPTEYFETDTRRWIRQRDALELVLLQHTADARAFTAMALRFCPDEEGAAIVWGDFHPEEAIPKLVEVSFDDQHIDGEDFSWTTTLLTTLLTALLEPVSLERRSERFRESRDKLLAMASDSVRREIIDHQWTIPVRIGVQFESEKSTTSGLKHNAQLKQSMDTVLQTTGQQKEETKRAELSGYPFRVSTVDVTLFGVKEPMMMCEGLDAITTNKRSQLGGCSLCRLRPRVAEADPRRFGPKADESSAQ